MIINNEECKLIPEFTRYVISESGRVYRITPLNSIERNAMKENPEKLYVRESKVQFYEKKNRGQWSQIGLTNDKGKFYTFPIEKLFCTAFNLWPDKKKGLEIKYKDGNVRNLCVENITFVPKKHHNAKLTKDDVKKIKRLIELGQPLRHIGVTFGVSEMQICRIKSGENWRRGGRLTPIPEPPFNVEAGRIRRLLSSFDYTEIDDTIRRPFTIKRNEVPTDNKIIGVLNGYRFSKPQKNISRARGIVYKLNKHFFGEDMAEKMDNKLAIKSQKLEIVS
jgi:hypothetical protein